MIRERPSMHPSAIQGDKETRERGRGGEETTELLNYFPPVSFQIIKD
jgi:hypothetical protein